MNLRKVLALTLYRRPQYTKQCLEALSQCYGIEDYTLIISCDYSFEYPKECDEVIEVVKTFNSCQTQIYVNKPGYGQHLNRFFISNKAFEITDYMIGLEEDTPLSKDGLRYFEYIGNNFGSDSNFISANGYNRYTELDTHIFNMRENTYVIEKGKTFNAWVFSMYKHCYQQLAGTQEAVNYWTHVDGFDWWVRNIMRNHPDSYVINPIVPRSNHVGWENSQNTRSYQWLMDNEFVPYGAWSQEMPDPPVDIWTPNWIEKTKNIENNIIMKDKKDYCNICNNTNNVLSKNWVRVNGNWGDTIIQLNYGRAATNNEQLNVIFYSSLPHREQIKEFIANQECIGEIIDLESLFDNITSRLRRFWWGPEESKECKKQLDIKFPEIDNIVIDSIIQNNPSASMLQSSCFPFVIPPKYIKDSPIEKPYVVLLPFSFISQLPAHHWSHWVELLQYVISKYPQLNFVLCGKDWNIEGNCPPNLINLLGKTETIYDVFNLANNADYTITTANCLSHWVRTNNLPSAIIENHNAQYGANKDGWQQIYWHHIPSNVKMFHFDSDFESVAQYVDSICQKIIGNYDNLLF